MASLNGNVINNAALYDQFLKFMTGIDNKTKKLVGKCGDPTYEDYLKLMRVMDEQDAVNRFEWINQGVELSSLEIERLLYYKGNLCFFYWKELDKFFLMPYTLDGSIDYYGRYNYIRPIPVYEGTDKEMMKYRENQRAALAGLKLRVIQDVVLEEDVDEDLQTNSAVIIRDYTNQLDQKNIPRQNLMDPLLRFISELPMYMRTALMNMTGIRGLRVNDQDASAEVMAANAQFKNAALNGNMAIPMTSPIEMQDLTNGSPANAQEFLMAWQTMDNVRLGFHGLEAGGIFQKKAHLLQSENTQDNGGAGGVLTDALSNRTNFCDIVNSIWDIGIDCFIKENATGDVNGDAILQDDTSALNAQSEGGEGDAI